MCVCPIRGHSFKSLQHLEGSHKGQIVKGLHEIKHYLNAFGYLKLNHNVGLSKYDHASNNFHLNVMGRLDSSTRDKMMTPRCRVTDDHNMSLNYALYNGNPKWDKNYLTYTFDSSVKPEVLEKLGPAVQQGFEEWLKHTQFTFGLVWIDQAFDGPSKVLAHSFPPTMGKMHFDADKNWSIDKPNGDQIGPTRNWTHSWTST
ncbi:hypothetical protein ACJW31_04G114000 [Castanea mollissima]